MILRLEHFLALAEHSLFFWLSFFFILLIFGSGLKDSFLGALVWAGILTWYFEKNSKEENQREKEIEDARIASENLSTLRNADTQEEAYTYQIGRHANETLALRYGLVNAKGNKELSTIKLRKLVKLQDAHYEVELISFGLRRAIAIIEPGT